METLDLESVKLFNIKTDLHYLDNVNEHRRRLLFEKAIPIFDNPISVVDDSNKIIGAAMVEVVGKTVVADIFIDNATPERFDIEEKTRKLWAIALGWSEQYLEKFVTKFYIKNIQISYTPPLDDRHPCL